VGKTGFVDDTISLFELGMDKVILDGYDPPMLITLDQGAAQLSSNEFLVFVGSTV